MKGPSKASADLVSWAKDYGWTWTGEFSGNGHMKLRHANGATYTIASTPSDRRATLNAKADLLKIAGRKEKKPAAAKYKKTPRRPPVAIRLLDELEEVDGLLWVTDPSTSKYQGLLAQRAAIGDKLQEHGTPVPPLD